MPRSAYVARARIIERRQPTTVPGDCHGFPSGDDDQLESHGWRCTGRPERIAGPPAARWMTGTPSALHSWRVVPPGPRPTCTSKGEVCATSTPALVRSAPPSQVTRTGPHTYFLCMLSTLLVIGGVLVGLLLLLALIVSLSARPQTSGRGSGATPPPPSWVLDTGRPPPDAWSPCPPRAPARSAPSADPPTPASRRLRTARRRDSPVSARPGGLGSSAADCPPASSRWHRPGRPAPFLLGAHPVIALTVCSRTCTNCP